MREITLTRGQVALVDDDDFEWLSQWRWYAQSNGRGGFYAARRARHQGPLIYMHRLIAGTENGLITDHVDGNGLNNQRSNLRSATQLQNMMNRIGKTAGSSRFKGVWFDARQSGARKWRSAIRINGKLKYLGRFEREEDAGAAYAAAASQHFGQFSNISKGSSQ